MPQVAPIIGNIAINLAIGIGASVLASAFAPQQKTRQVTTQRGLTFELEVGEGAAVSAVLGLGRAVGQLVYINEYGTDNEYVQFVIKIGHGRHDGLEAFLVDEKEVTLSGSNNAARGRSVDEFTVEGTPYLWVKTYTGAPGQQADPELVDRARPSSRWTSAHRMTGCAYMVITARYNEDLFGSAIPRFGSVWRGLRLYDWRVPGAVWGNQNTYVFTANPAVIRYNFRRGIYVNGVRILGQGFSSFANDLAGYTAAANRCDESFFDPVSGKTFPVFAFGRQVNDDEEKLSVLQELDDSYCGSSFKRGGADVPLPAQQLVPVMTLTDADRVRGYPVRADRKGTVSVKKTMWHGRFVSRDSEWALSPYVPRIDAALESVIGGRRAITLDQPYEHLQERAQLRAEIALRRQFYPATRVETFVPKALVLEPGDPVTRNSEWGPMLMVVEKVDPLPDRTGVTVTLTQWNNAIVPPSGGSFITLPDGPGAGPANPNRMIAVSGFGIGPYQMQGGGAVFPGARATWTQITDPNVDEVMIRVWPAAGTEANDAQDFFASARLQTARTFGPLQDETTFKAKAIPIRSDARATVWTNEAEFTTGPAAMPTDIPDGGVSLQSLDNRLASAFGTIVTDRKGSITDLLGAMEEQLEDLAASVARITAQGEHEKQEIRTHLLAQRGEVRAVYNHVATVVASEMEAMAHIIEQLGAEVGGVQAAVIAESMARADADEALAVSMLEVAAKADLATAGGMVGWEVTAGPGGGSVRYRLVGRVVTDGGFGEFGMFGTVNPDLSSELMFTADRFHFWNGDVAVQPVSIIDGTLVFKEGRFEYLTSLDGETIVLDGLTAHFSFG